MLFLRTLATMHVRGVRVRGGSGGVAEGRNSDKRLGRPTARRSRNGQISTECQGKSNARLDCLSSGSTSMGSPISSFGGQ
jgi:hypothetical protein